jgi:hypothetical protein
MVIVLSLLGAWLLVCTVIVLAAVRVAAEADKVSARASGATRKTASDRGLEVVGAAGDDVRRSA